MPSVHPQRHPLARAVRRRLQVIAPVSTGDRLLVAVSGGLDSVVLLHLMRFADIVRGCNIIAAHFDHGMRANSSHDADWVRGLTLSWEVAVEMGRAKEPLRSEADARRARYAFLEGAADRTDAGWILTAHHADDQAETVLFRILRGTGIAGLAGIPPRRNRLLRPLLRIRRQRLASYARAFGIRWREDPTNRDLQIARNRIRREVLPYLESVRPGTTRALIELADDATAAERVLARVLHEAGNKAFVEESDALVLARDILLSYDPWVRARVMRTAMTHLGSVPGRAGTIAASAFLQKARSGATLHLPGGLRMERAFDRILLRRLPDQPSPDLHVTIGDAREGSGALRVGGETFTVAWGTTARSGGTSEGFDLAALDFPLTVRGWLPGDRIRLAYGSRKLKKLFNDRKLARWRRYRVPVVADSAGRVLWVVGVARGALASPTPEGPTLFIRIGE